MRRLKNTVLCTVKTVTSKSKNPDGKLRRFYTKYFEIPATSLTNALGLSPTAVTVFGLLVAVAGATLVALGLLWQGGLVYGFGALLDAVDGATARRYGKVSKSGALLDSFFDRVQEGALMIALIVYFAYTAPGAPETLGMVLAATALFGSYSFSYIRAVSGSHGVVVKAGFFARAERSVVTVLFLVIGQPLWLLAVFLLFIVPSVVLRALIAYRALGKSEHRE